MSRVTLKDRLPEINASLRPKVTTALKHGAQDVADNATMRAPRSTADKPHMADHIEVRRRGAGAYGVGIYDSDFFYARFVERGTVHQAAQPFLVPAAEDEKESVVVKVEVVLKTL